MRPRHETKGRNLVAATAAMALVAASALALPAPAHGQILLDIDTPSSFMEELREETASGEPVDAERLVGWLAEEIEVTYKGKESMGVRFLAFFVNEEGDVQARVDSRPFDLKPGEHAAGAHLDVRSTAGTVVKYFPDANFSLDDYYFPDSTFLTKDVMENASSLMPGMRMERGQGALIVVAAPEAGFEEGYEDVILGPAVLVFGPADR